MARFDKDDPEYQDMQKMLHEAAAEGDPWAKRALALEAMLGQDTLIDKRMDERFPLLKQLIREQGFWQYILYLLSIAQLAASINAKQQGELSAPYLAQLFTQLELGVYGGPDAAFANFSDGPQHG